MKNRKMNFRMIAGILTAMSIMSNMAAISAKACDFEEVSEVQEIVEVQADAEIQEDAEDNNTYEYVEENNDYQPEPTDQEPTNVETTYEEPVYVEPAYEEPVMQVSEDQHETDESIQNDTEQNRAIAAISEPAAVEVTESKDVETAEKEEVIEIEAAEIEETEAVSEVEEKVEVKEVETEEVEVAQDEEVAETEKEEVVEQEEIKTEEVKETVADTVEAADLEEEQNNPISAEDKIQAIKDKYNANIILQQENLEKITNSKEVKTTVVGFDNGIKLIIVQRYINGKLFEETISDNGMDEIIDEGQRVYEERKKQEEIDRQIREFQDKLNAASMDELIDIYNELSKGTDKNIVTINSKEKETQFDAETENEIGEKVYQASLSLVKESISGVLGLIPGSDFFKNTTSNIVCDLIGLSDEKTDIEKIIENGNKELKNELVAGFKDTRDNIDNYGTLKCYGERLDDFTDYALLRADGIKTYQESERLSELEKKVWIANLIGSSDEWYTGANNGNILKSMKSASEVFKGEKDVDSRDLYNVIYEINQKDSLFTGEAMAKSQNKIEKALGGFIRNCEIVKECLKAHKEISNLTQEEIDSLEPQTRAIYDRIHADTATVTKQIKTISNIFFGDKSSTNKKDQTGIFDKATEYYNKDKAVYIDHGRNNIELSDNLMLTEGRSYVYTDNTLNFDRVNTYATPNGLTKADLEKIVKQAKDSNMTIKDYLEASGFHVYGQYLVVGTKTETDAHWEGPLNHRYVGYTDQGLAAYDMTKLNPEEEMIYISRVQINQYHFGTENDTTHGTSIDTWNLYGYTATFQAK